MTRILTWLNRHPCRCTHTLGAPGAPLERFVNVLCWRHALLWWLGERFILLAGEGSYWHTGHIEWRPWYWGGDGYMRNYRREQRLGLRPSDDEYFRELIARVEAQAAMP